MSSDTIKADLQPSLRGAQPRSRKLISVIGKLPEELSSYIQSPESQLQAVPIGLPPVPQSSVASSVIRQSVTPIEIATRNATFKLQPKPVETATSIPIPTKSVAQKTAPPTLLKRKTAKLPTGYTDIHEHPTYETDAIQKYVTGETEYTKQLDDNTKTTFKEYIKYQDEDEHENKYMLPLSLYIPPTRKRFYSSIYDTYQSKFALPLVPKGHIDQDACAKMGQAGTARAESFLYQKFIREYLRQATPYRGVLVYHGLGSGKTCSAIGAAESLFGVADKKVIIMTPKSLRSNFVNEIMFCGFRHYQLRNYWTSIPMPPKVINKKPNALHSIYKLYALSVLSLSKSFVDRIMLRPDESSRRLWIPDFTKTEEEWNYNTLSPEEKSEIQQQVQETINNRYTFINYNGITPKELHTMICNPKKTTIEYPTEESSIQITPSSPEYIEIEKHVREKYGNEWKINIIENKIYITKEEMPFDNAVIVIDEVHNMTRLMRGTIDAYMIERPKTKRRTPVEEVLPGKWNPSKCKSVETEVDAEKIRLDDEYTQKKFDIQKKKSSIYYKKAYSLYRLLSQARNSKIIALSGTPLINFPEELGILSNILGGYTDCVEFKVNLKDDAIVTRIKDTVSKHPRVDMVYIKEADNDAKAISVLISTFPAGYINPTVSTTTTPTPTFDGVIYENTPESNLTIIDIFPILKEKIILQLQQLGYDGKVTGTIIEKEKYKSYPRLPFDGDTFSKFFLNPTTLEIENQQLLKKRLTGIISYYKGSKEEYMPSIKEDIEVPCYMSDYQLSKYEQIRLMEIDDEDTKRKLIKDPKDKFYSIVEEINRREASPRYRFGSRAVGNFAFPKDIHRPFPTEEEDADIKNEIGELKDLVLAEGVANPEEDDAAEKIAEEEDASIDEPDEEITTAEAPEATDATDAAGTTPDTKEKIKEKQLRYKQNLSNALNTLEANKDTYLNEESLPMYSSKMAELIKRMNMSPGSNLVYSQFKSVEGIYILGLAMKAHGYDEIKITGTETNPVFSPETLASFQNPQKNKKRFISFTGDGSTKTREWSLAIFNGKYGVLPPGLQKPLIEFFKVNTENEVNNLYGDICRTFCITSAGAEGLSLKAVRTVHILEPYWNSVRLEQVKGRAIRICSHSELTNPEDRNVSIYTYIAAFTDEQKKSDEKLAYSIRVDDNGLTSDQYILDISKKKDVVNNQLLKIMKEVAVDCTTNAPDNGGIVCFETSETPDVEGKSTDTYKTSTGMYMFHPNIDEDLKITTREIGILSKQDVYMRQMSSVSGIQQSIGQFKATIPLSTTQPSQLAAAAAASTSKTTSDYTRTIKLSQISYKNKKYLLADKRDSGGIIKQMFDESDIKLKNPVGEISINPLTGKYQTPILFA